jgi:hypothetical protein
MSVLLDYVVVIGYSHFGAYNNAVPFLALLLLYFTVPSYVGHIGNSRFIREVPGSNHCPGYRLC